MPRFLILAFLALAPAMAQTPPTAAPPAPADPQTGGPLNVNERYTIEAIEAKLPGKRKLSPDLRQKMDDLVGKRFNQSKVDEIQKAIKEELRNFKVTQRIAKGDKPEHLKVIFETQRNAVEVTGDSDDFKAIYHSKNNFSFGGTGRFGLGDTGVGVLFGALTDNDLRVERFSGIRSGFDRLELGGNLRVQFIAESYRSQWNGSTLAADPGRTEVYRTRQNLEPTVTVRPVGPLTLTAGLSFARYQYQFPAARNVSANAVISSLRFARQWDKTSGTQQSLGAGYDLRAATSSLGSDTRFTRHEGRARYEGKNGPHEWIFESRLGSLGGRAPLYEAFVLGNTETLRGWNRFDVAPLGGNRMAHGSAEYRYRGFRFLYDTGAVWQAPAQDPKQRHSAAIGYIDSGIALLVAFPLRDGNVTPLVMLGYTF